MPWCDPCEKSWTPTSLDADGTCPQCGGKVEGTPGVDHEPHRIPWHFWLMVGAISIYLSYRLVELILWIF